MLSTSEQLAVLPRPATAGARVLRESASGGFGAMATRRLRAPRLRQDKAARPGRRWVPAAVLALLLGSAAGASVTTGTAAQAASPCTTSGTTVACTYAGARTYSFPVPAGVTAVDVTAVGAGGGNSATGGAGSVGGLGASVEDT